MSNRWDGYIVIAGMGSTVTIVMGSNIWHRKYVIAGMGSSRWDGE